MLQAFFDNEKVITKQDGTRLALRVVYTEDVDVETEVAKGGYVTYTLSDEENYENSKTVVVDYLNRKLARNPLKAALYHMLSEYTGKTLPWGSMTGVRPTKVATERLEHGAAVIPEI